MDVRLSAEQRALRESAALLVERLRPQSVLELDDGERAMKLDAAVAGSGWRELRGDGGEGEPWASAVEVAIVAEELGRGAADTALLGPILAAELRRLTGAAATGEGETVALTADLCGPVVAAVGEGRVGAVAIDAAGARSALVLLPVAAGYEIGEVALTSDADAGVDLTRTFLACELPGRVSSVEGQHRKLTADDLARWTALGLAATCADLVGVMQGSIRLACDHAVSRRQFGSSIGSFQAVQHLLAEALVAMEGSRSVALHAAWAVDASPPREALAAAALAKAYCARAARTVCETSIQVHGGIGNTWECFAHVYLRRALASGDMFGGIGKNLDRVLDHYQLSGGRGLDGLHTS